MNDFEKSLNNILVNTFNNILKYEEQSLKSISGITVSEAHIIEAISNHKVASVSEIATSLDIAVPTATVAIKKLEKKGFIIKVPCKKDGRRTLISLTELGRKIDHAHNIFHRKMVTNVSKNFNSSEKKLLLNVIAKLNEFFQKKVEA